MKKVRFLGLLFFVSYFAGCFETSYAVEEIHVCGTRIGDTFLFGWGSSRKITGINIWADGYVRALDFLSNGVPERVVGTQTGPVREVRFDEDEILMGFFGRSGDAIDSLGFITNKRDCGPWGGGGGGPFRKVFTGEVVQVKVWNAGGPWGGGPTFTRGLLANVTKIPVIRTLPKNEFDFKLVNKEFFRAWEMGETAMGMFPIQGDLWKKISFAKTKEYLKKLVRKSILEGTPEKMVKAKTLAGLFPDVVPAAAGAAVGSLRSQLLAFIETQKIKAEDFLAGL